MTLIMPDEQQKTGSVQDTPATGISSDGGQLHSDLDEANKKIQELTETAKRALADLQNYRKKTEEEKANFVQFANAALIIELLPILDNFTRAFSHVPNDIAASDWFKGAVAIEQQLVSIMQKYGVKEASSSLGTMLDPKIHEAVAVGPGEKDVIIEEYEKGYLLGDKVIRPAKVKVGDGSIEKT